MDGGKLGATFPILHSAELLFIVAGIVRQHLQAGTHQGAAVPPIQLAGLSVAIEDCPTFHVMEQNCITRVFEKFAISLGEGRLAPQPLVKDSGSAPAYPSMQDETDYDSEKPDNHRGNNQRKVVPRWQEDCGEIRS